MKYLLPILLMIGVLGLFVSPTLAAEDKQYVTINFVHDTSSDMELNTNLTTNDNPAVFPYYSSELNQTCGVSYVQVQVTGDVVGENIGLSDVYCFNSDNWATATQARVEMMGIIKGTLAGTSEAVDMSGRMSLDIQLPPWEDRFTVPHIMEGYWVFQKGVGTHYGELRVEGTVDWLEAGEDSRFIGSGTYTGWIMKNSPDDDEDMDGNQTYSTSSGRELIITINLGPEATAAAQAQVARVNDALGTNWISVPVAAATFVDRDCMRDSNGTLICAGPDLSAGLYLVAVQPQPGGPPMVGILPVGAFMTNEAVNYYGDCHGLTVDADANMAQVSHQMSDANMHGVPFVTDRWSVSGPRGTMNIWIEYHRKDVKAPAEDGFVQINTVFNNVDGSKLRPNFKNVTTYILKKSSENIDNVRYMELKINHSNSAISPIFDDPKNVIREIVEQRGDSRLEASWELPTEICDDGIDNDCDTLIDEEDPDCSEPTPAP
jgi:hypothetical protein